MQLYFPVYENYVPSYKKSMTRLLHTMISTLQLYAPAIYELKAAHLLCEMNYSPRREIREQSLQGAPKGPSLDAEIGHDGDN